MTTDHHAVSTVYNVFLQAKEQMNSHLLSDPDWMPHDALEDFSISYPVVEPLENGWIDSYFDDKMRE